MRKYLRWSFGRGRRLDLRGIYRTVKDAFSLQILFNRLLALSALVTLVSIRIMSAVTLASVIKREYLHTFYDTASALNQKAFFRLEKTQDSEKSSILTVHPDVYMSSRQKLIKPWTIKNWNRSEEETPS